MEKTSSKSFTGKFTHLSGPRCPICDLPNVENLTTLVTSTCSGCGFGLVYHRDRLKSIEEYLDPDDIVNFSNFEEFSPEFHQNLRIEADMNRQRLEEAKRGTLSRYMGRFEKWRDLGMIRWKQQQAEEFMYCMIMALHDYNACEGFWLNIVQAACNFGYFPLAERALDIVRRLNPTSPQLTRIMAFVQHEMLKYPSHGHSVSREEYRAQIYERMGDLASMGGNISRAILRYTQLLGLHPEDIRIWSNIGSQHLQIGDISGARNAFERIIALNPKDPRGPYQMMNIHVLERDIPGAIRRVKEAMVLDPANPRYAAKLRQLEELRKE